MKINTINNNNSTNFGAQVKFANPNHKLTMPNIGDYTYANKVLDKFYAYHPHDKILIELVTKENKYDSCLKAINLTNYNKEVQYRLLPEDALKDFNDVQNSKSGCKTFYQFLENLLNKDSYKNFWGDSIAAKTEVACLPSEHSVFNA